MKRLTFLFLIISISTACSSDDSNDNLDPNKPENSNFKFMSTRIYEPTEPRNSSYDNKDTIAYKDGKPIKVLKSGNGMIQYEYGNNGRISEIYSKSEVYNDGVSSQDLINIFENSSLNEDFDLKLIFSYDSQNRLTKIVKSEITDWDFNFPVQLKYDEQGRLYKYIQGSETIYTVNEFDDKGNPTSIIRNYDGSISEINYEYGDLKNPYYALYHEYEIWFLDPTFDPRFISPNVPIAKPSSYENIIFNYTSSDGEYPESLHYNSDGYEAVYEFTYR